MGKINTIVENMRRHSRGIKQTAERNARLDAREERAKPLADERRGYAIDTPPSDRALYGRRLNTYKKLLKKVMKGDRKAANDLNILTRRQNSLWKRGQKKRDKAAGIKRKPVKSNPFSMNKFAAREGSDAHLWDINNGRKVAARMYIPREHWSGKPTDIDAKGMWEGGIDGYRNGSRNDTSGTYDDVTPSTFQAWKAAQ
jgi:hypothetical protein